MIKFAQIVKNQKPGKFDYLKLTNRLMVFATKFAEDPAALNMAISTYKACEILEPSDCEIVVARVRAPPAFGFVFACFSPPSFFPFQCVKFLCGVKKSAAFTQAYQKIKDLLQESNGIL